MSPKPHKVAAFFDLDKTIIATSSAAAFSRPLLDGGVMTRAEALRSAYSHLLYLLRGANAERTERLRENLSALVTGWDVSTVSRIVSQTLHEYVDPYVYAEAMELMETHRAHGHDVVVVSASGTDLVEPIAAMLGADHVIATRMTEEDGRYTGGIDFYAYGENKAVAMRELAAEQGYDLDACYAYSDSVTDAPMLAAVGNGFTVNPDRALRRLAIENGWKVLRFARPVTLRRRLNPTTPLVVAGIVAAGVVIWIAARRVHRVKPSNTM